MSSAAKFIFVTLNFLKLFFVDGFATGFDIIQDANSSNVVVKNKVGKERERLKQDMSSS